MKEEELNLVKLLTENSCRRMFVGALSEITIGEMDKMVLVDPLWRQRVKGFGKNFLLELTKESNRLLGENKSDKQLLDLARIMEGDIKDIYNSMYEQVLKLMLDEKDNTKEVPKEIQADTTTK